MWHCLLMKDQIILLTLLLTRLFLETILWQKQNQKVPAIKKELEVE